MGISGISRKGRASAYALTNRRQLFGEVKHSLVGEVKLYLADGDGLCNSFCKFAL